MGDAEQLSPQQSLEGGGISRLVYIIPERYESQGLRGARPSGEEGC